MGKNPKYWVYKCNSRGGEHQVAEGDWNEVFSSVGATDWGSTEWIPQLKEAARGDLILAYQTNRNELVGVVRVERVQKRGRHLDLYLKPVEELRVKVRPLKQASERIDRIPALQPGPIKTLYDISKADAERLLHAARKVSPVGIKSASTAAEDWASGGGFGSAKDNRKVERAAMRTATVHLVRDGWEVEDISSLKCGYDLECTKGRSKLHVEVKGSSGLEKKFILTQNELATWETDQNYCLMLVTLALEEHPLIESFHGKSGLAQIRRQPIAHACVVK
jgi:hypothetical protein